ncbi:class I SAM-dependent methyltransferase [Fontibacter flavus]|uniref:Class I SAM-dependent methyltransferase n=1 Tax=Fontibacter flavus TaxID=654838 RepID=A0ABV6FUD8_9BACT
MMNKPSFYHNNRGIHNWVVYEVMDEFITKYSNNYKDILYELGCGTKPYEVYFKQFCEAYIGVDWFETLHLKAEIIADLNKSFPIEDSAADTLVSFSVMEHLCEPQIFLNESYRILKNGGVFILQVPFMWHVHEEPFDFYRYTKYGLKYMFEKAGYTNIEIEASTGFLVNWVLKLNYQLIRVLQGNSVKKKLQRTILRPFIKNNQKFALFLDKRWPKTDKETQGYWVVAKK